jgi:hypothetical protein
VIDTFMRRTVIGSLVLAALVLDPGSLAPTGGIGAFAQPVPSSARAGQRPCSEAKSLRSLHSREPTAITFVNSSGMYRALHWVDFRGQTKDYAGLNPGERKTIDTFRTHPWMITTGPGDCLYLIMPAAEPATVQLK